MTRALLFLVAIGTAYGQVSINGINGQSIGFTLSSGAVEAQAPIAKVSSGSGTTITQAFGGQTTKGNSIVCIGFASAAAQPTITDADSNTYVAAGGSSTAPGYVVAIANNIAGTSADTITETTSSGAASFTCHEIKGTVTVGQIWDVLSGQQGTGASINFGTVGVGSPNELVIAAVGIGGGTVNATPKLGNSVTGLTTVDASNTSVSGGAALSDFYAAHANANRPMALTQSVSLSASETYSGVLVTVAPAVWNPSSGDPCHQPVKQQSQISVTANTQLISGVSGQQVYVCSIDIGPTAATATNVALVEGTGSTCGTNTAGLMGGSAASTGWAIGTNGGVAMGSGGNTLTRTATAGDNVCILVSAANQISGVVSFVIQ